MSSVWRSIWTFIMLICAIVAIFFILGVLPLVFFPSKWLS